jgi:16S rRNA (cytidine1402-2'-O)-methyltransferase
MNRSIMLPDVLAPALYLMPVPLGESPAQYWQVAHAHAMGSQIRHWVVETPKTARAIIGNTLMPSVPLRDMSLHAISADTTAEQLIEWLAPIQQGLPVGLMSDAGCPAVADPGARLVRLAHDLGLPVRPWVGPSALLLALMASGLDGQRFAFHGYAPSDRHERAQTLREWELASRQRHQTQLFIETPYRNQAMLEACLETLNPQTRLCVACGLTTAQEWVQSLPVQRWRERSSLPGPLQKVPAVFLFLA